jgi:hypothetical protein
VMQPFAPAFPAGVLVFKPPHIICFTTRPDPSFTCLNSL